MEQGGHVPVPPSTPSSRGRSGVANGGFDRATQATNVNVPQSGSMCGPYLSSGCQFGPYQNVGVQPGVSSCFGCQPCFGGCGFPSQMSGGVFPAPGQREGRMNEGFVPPPGGLTPQATVLQQIAHLVGSLNSGQTRELQQMLAERSQVDGRQVPEFFGDVPRVTNSEPFVPDLSRGVWNSEEVSAKETLDAFSRSEKWLSPAPFPQVELWKNRELEILGWSDFLTQLVSWSAQGSELFSNEIAQAAKWPTAIEWSTLSKAQRSRSTRLHAILKSAFVSHPRTSMLISVFGEGMNLLSDGVFGSMSVSQANSNGYEMLRQLSLEFCLRSRGEALSMRAALVAKSFVLSASETTVGSVVSDTIRKLDYECSRYNKLLATLPPNVDPTGLNLPEADVLIILLKSLPAVVRDFCLHHSTGESLQAYRRAAMRWEEQQRVFQEVGQGQQKKVNQIFGWDSSSPQTEVYQLDSWDEGSYELSAVGSQKCSKCGSRKHTTADCATDMAKVKCFRCGIYGHIGLNCSNKQDKGKGKGAGDRGKGSHDKGRGKGKGFKGGRKGKLNELSSDQAWDNDQWWADDSGWYWYEPGVEQISYWDDYDWNEQTWDSHEYVEGVTQGSETKTDDTGHGNGQGSQSVGSLVLSAVLGEVGKHVSEEFCSFSMSEQTNNERHVEDLQPFFDEPRVFETTEGFSGESFSTGSEKQGCEIHVGSSSSNECLGDVRGDAVREPVWSLEDMQFKSLKQVGFGVVGDCMRCNTPNFHEGLVCDSPMALRVFKTRRSTFLNFQQEMPTQAMLRRYAGTVCHLLSEVAANEGFEWWLLDSGAAVTVLAHQNLERYGAQVNAFDTAKDNFCVLQMVVP